MTLYNEWKDLLNNQTKKTIDAFWKEYAGAESKIYTYILQHQDETLSGTLGELAEKFEVRPVMMTGFTDGVLTSLKDGAEIDLENLNENTELSFPVDFPKLYENMLRANASHLYTLPAWDDVLTEDERSQITRAYKKSKTYIAPKKIGRNDPCPCGSGKKYKNCCGKRV